MQWEGNKSNYFKYIEKYLVKCNYYIEPFLGGGNVLFKVLENYNNYYNNYIVNDLSDILYKTYCVLSDIKGNRAITNRLNNFVVTQTGFKEIHQRYNKIKNYNNDIDKVFDFLVLKYFSFMSKTHTSTLNYGINLKYKLLNEIKKQLKLFRNNKINITNKDYINFLKNIPYTRNGNALSQFFIYCDPPYNNTKSKFYEGKFDIMEMLNLLNNNFKESYILVSYNIFDKEYGKYDFYLLEILDHNTNPKHSNSEVLIGNKTLCEYIKNRDNCNLPLDI